MFLTTAQRVDSRKVNLFKNARLMEDEKMSLKRCCSNLKMTFVVLVNNTHKPRGAVFAKLLGQLFAVEIQASKGLTTRVGSI
jgi:hypothetical protein